MREAARSVRCRGSRPVRNPPHLDLPRGDHAAANVCRGLPLPHRRRGRRGERAAPRCGGRSDPGAARSGATGTAVTSLACSRTTSSSRRGTRNVTPALSYCDLVLQAPKPLDRAYPTELRSIGDHIRKRRPDLGLLQREVALRIGVDKTTVYDWEVGTATPNIRTLPGVVRLLGYERQADPTLKAGPGSLAQVGRIRKPSRRAASSSRPSRQTNVSWEGSSSHHNRAAASWNASAARRGCMERRRPARRRTSSLGATVSTSWTRAASRSNAS